MITPNAQDAKHKTWLFRLLSALVDDAVLAGTLYFKGGTCAAMRGFLDRFSVDLDFDYVGKKENFSDVKRRMENIFKRLDLEIKDKSKTIPQYFLKYPAKPDERNTLKIDVSFPPPRSNQYESVVMAEIDRIVFCQTIETMFANKLVALIERFEKSHSIAGRDMYDIHHFFFNGHSYDARIIEERRNCPVRKFFKDLIGFVDKNITQTIIDQDINTLLDQDKFRQIRKLLKPETLVFLQDELKRLK